MLVLSACASQALLDEERKIDALAAVIEATPAPAPDGPMTWTRLREAAEVGGPAFLQSKISETQARLDLDARRAGRRPKVSALLTARINGNASGASDLVAGGVRLGLDYDVAAALVGLGREDLALGEELVTLRRSLSDRSATLGLLGAYADYGQARFTTEEAELDLRALECDRESQAVDVALGTAPATVLSQTDRRRASARSAIGLLQDDEDAARSRLLSEAGISRPAVVPLVPLSVAALPDAATRPAACYRTSGAEARDLVLSRIAELALERAEVSRFTQFSAIIPTQLDPRSGLDLDVLVNWIVPLLDQGGVKRSVQQARAELLALALSARRDRITFDQTLSEARRDLAQARLAVATAQAILPELDLSSADALTDAGQCRQDLARDRRQLEERRAAFARSLAEARISTLCAPG